jgi:mRNA-degrading endonuclease RelE of RelBE toxin-antitoxin system
VFRLLFSADVEKDLKRIPAFQRKRILDDIEASLAQEPTAPSKNRKLLVNLTPPWETISAVWELRVGEYRVFYDVDEAAKVVYIRAVRKKPQGKTTEEIL